MSEPESIVFVVDDDPSVRSAIKRLIVCVGLQVELFESAQEFLASKLPNVPSCLVLDDPGTVRGERHDRGRPPPAPRAFPRQHQMRATRRWWQPSHGRNPET